jgi:acyl-CoA synthetase (AMP-forming)/AMP-acid ligase II
MLLTDGAVGKDYRQDPPRWGIRRILTGRIRIPVISDVIPQTAIHTVADLIRGRAADAPDGTALIFERRETSLSLLNSRASQVANGLLALDGAERTVAVLDTNSDTFFELLFGSAKANRPILPLNWRLTPAELRFMINDAAADVLFVGSEFFSHIEAICHECPTLRTIMTIDGHHDGWESCVSWRERQSATDPQLPAAGSTAVLHLYTSGTTGVPKAVRLTNDNILAGTPNLSCEFGYAKTNDVSLVCLPVFHVSGSLWALSCLYAGATCLILRKVDPAAILDAVGRQRVSKMFLVPIVIRLLLQADAIHTTDLSSLHLIVYGASPIPVDLLRTALTTFKCQFAQVYGLTETCGAITYLRPSDHDLENSERLGSCGRPLPGVEIRIVDEQGVDVPAGQLGEITCRTPQNMSGYWNRPEHNRTVFYDGWLRTGDAGFIDSEGYLYIRDRINDLIITGGENVYPAEVESILVGHPAVADAAVIGVPDERWGEIVAAVVVKKPGMDVTDVELIQFSRQRIATYKTPRMVQFAASLPRNAAGKLLRQEVRAPYWVGYKRRVN